MVSDYEDKKVTIQEVYVPKGSGNNPYGGKMDKHYVIREWGFIFANKKDAEVYAKEHKRLDSGEVVKK